MLWIGVTGGIASGKSTFKNIFKGLLLDKTKINQAHQSKYVNFGYIDADEISHALTQKNASGYIEILKEFSQFHNEILDINNEIDRKKLGQLVFSRPELRLKLEAVLHPLIQKEVQSKKNEFENQKAKACFYDVPLLFEKKLEAQFDKIVVIFSPESIQRHRLMIRNNLSIEEAQTRLKAQFSINEKLAKADFCIDNSSDIESLELQVHRFYLQVLNL